MPKNSPPLELLNKDNSEIACSGIVTNVVFVVDQNNKTLMPTSPKRARLLLKNKKADVYRKVPFTIRVLNRTVSDVQSMELKFDPGSKTTGIALLVQGAKRGWFCISAWELKHRGDQIKNALLSRAQLRFGRRSRKTRYRKPRFLNRKRKEGWLPPSLQSRIDNVQSFTRKIVALCPLSSISVEQVKFDTQLMQNEYISGAQYQQGTLQGYEVREYLLEKWSRKCAYCNTQNTPLQIEHIVAKSKGGSNRVSNLCLACTACNQKKGNRSVEEFLKNKPDLLKRIVLQAKRPLKDAAAVNATRKAVVLALQTFAIPVTTSTGGRTKYNRIAQGYQKEHWLDAVCVGHTGENVDISDIQYVTIIQAKGRGNRQMCKTDKFGFPNTKSKSVKRLHGFQSGDLVILNNPNGKNKGVYNGIVSIRKRGQFDVFIKRSDGNFKISANYKHFVLKRCFDGYSYTNKMVSQ